MDPLIECDDDFFVARLPMIDKKKGKRIESLPREYARIYLLGFLIRSVSHVRGSRRSACFFVMNWPFPESRRTVCVFVPMAAHLR
jgi:hypothetical protein